MKTKKRNNFYPKKSLGQNFLIDPNTIRKIVDAIEGPSDMDVVEIGAGKGALTNELADRGYNLKAIEIDGRLIPSLLENFSSFPKVEIIQADVLDYLKTALPQDGYVLIGNLPYYITTPIIMAALAAKTPPEQMVFMMQKEVADRIVARPGGKTYGALSVYVQVVADVRLVLNVSPQVFSPQPAVSSAVLSFSPHKRHPMDRAEKQFFDQVVKAAFAQRRKTVQNSLLTLGKSKDQIGLALERAEIAPARRAETISVPEYICLAKAFMEQTNR